jgi:hypothetical protein
MAREDVKAAAYLYLKNMTESLQIVSPKTLANVDAPPPPKKSRAENSLREFEDSSDEDEECPVNEVDAYLEARLSKAEST